MMQPSGPQLRDIHLPPMPAWWPPAPGWWMLAALVLALAGFAFCSIRRYRRARWQRHKVLDELQRIGEQHARDGDKARLLAELHQLLRRVARRHDAQAIRQRGGVWKQTLSRVPVDASVLQQLLALDDWLYRPPAQFDEVAAIAAVRRWLQVALKPSRWKAVPVEQADA
ncbi:DUF4381 family protein [Rhodanobacter sp. AS-Z3]|uniref:DUF4381 family protein n=1 Tax=Rhodanobacter sp. AS-Z3 TaxID=3031330 RepID=UPI002478BFC8|nr:DUF4381 family protein [Rhodanobacter sp. AS-Z3]WEN16087.1 DUF4381 family protein [Rhodanobacter sp. AS-Z3]